MESTLAAADGVCILQLQDRSLGMLMLMLAEPISLFLVMMLWFPFRLLHLFFTSIFPVLPFVHAWDGVVSCLRTGSFEETLGLTERALGKKANLVGERNTGVVGEKIVVAECGEWKFVGVRRLHTWPFGYMNAFLVRKQV
jgi:hypothetical protein